MKDLCLNVPCEVMLNHSNVCYGVERSWPKRMFDQPDFKKLQPIQQTKIYADMERKAVLLYNKYVNKERLDKRRRKRTNRTLAPYYEEMYRRNHYNRIKELGEPDQANNTITEESIVLSDSEPDNSLQTVINTGSYRGNRSESSARKDAPIIDLNENDNNFIVSDENIAHNVEVESVASGNNEDDKPSTIVDVDNYPDFGSYRVNKKLPSIEVDNSNDDDDVLTIDEHFGDMMSESEVTSTFEDNDFQQSHVPPLCFTPQIDSHDILTADTPAIAARQFHRSINYENDDDNDDIVEFDVDSIDFYSQQMIGIRTSTQQ